MLEYGYIPEFNISLVSSNIPEAEERLQIIKECQEDAKAALQLAADRMKHFYDKHVKDAPEFKEGDKVWLEAQNVQQRQPSIKLSHKRLGPYKVVRKIGDLNYQLELPKSMKIHPVFHVGLLSEHKVAAHIPDRTFPEPPPDEIEPGVFEYEVEKIIDSKFQRGQLHYLIHWKGYSAANRTWEHEKNIANATDQIKEFYRRHPNAPKRIAKVRFAEIPWRPRETFTEWDKPVKQWDWDAFPNDRKGIPSEKHCTQCHDTELCMSQGCHGPATSGYNTKGEMPCSHEV